MARTLIAAEPVPISYRLPARSRRRSASARSRGKTPEKRVSTILQRIAEGDPQAVQECIDQYGGLIWSVARRLLGDHTEAEDAVQDVFVELWKTAGRFDGNLSSEKSFVVMVARRRIIDRLRRAVRRLDNVSVDDDNMPQFASEQHGDIERSAEASMAARALLDLAPERRRVLELSIYEGMSHSEIAAAVDMPIGTVKSHITRGLAHVREALLSPPSDGERG